MAGDWLKVEIATPDKPEVLAITAKMGWDDPDLTLGKLFRFWRWFDQHTRDGNAVGVTFLLLDRIIGVTGFAQVVADVGWLSVTSDGVQLPNFDRHNGKTAKTRALTFKRVAKLRDERYKCNALGVNKSLPEKRREVLPPFNSKGGHCNATVTLTALQTPHGLTDLQYATRLMEEIKMPHTPANLKQVAAGIKAEEETQGGLAQAYDFVLVQARLEVESKGTVTGFWFQDAKWRQKKQQKGNTGILAVNGADLQRKAAQRLGGK